MSDKQTKRRVLTEEDFCTSLVGNIYSGPTLPPLAHSTACDYARQQWPTPAQ